MDDGNFVDVLSFSALHEIPSQSSAAVAKMDERLAACLLAWFFPSSLARLVLGTFIIDIQEPLL